MTTDGIEYVFLTTHHWDKATQFFQALGFELEFATDHNSGVFRNSSGPYLFVAEVPAGEAPNTQIALKLSDGDAHALDPIVEVVTPMADTHWGTKEMTVRDPDGRIWSLEAPADG